jgi:hypothetical protein
MSAYGKGPVLLFFLLAAVVFLAEFLIMVLLYPAEGLYHALLDSSLLLAAILPVFYFFVYRPLRAELEKRERGENVLKEKVDELERFRAAAVGRELRLKELKEKIKRLEELRRI